MFEIKITEAVLSHIESNLKKKLESPLLMKDQSVFEAQFIATKQSLEIVCETLKINPFSYPKFKKGIYIVVNTYLPYILFYRIEGLNVILFDCKKRDKLF